MKYNRTELSDYHKKRLIKEYKGWYIVLSGHGYGAGLRKHNPEDKKNPYMVQMISIKDNWKSTDIGYGENSIGKAMAYIDRKEDPEGQLYIRIEKLEKKKETLSRNYERRVFYFKQSIKEIDQQVYHLNEEIKECKR